MTPYGSTGRVHHRTRSASYGLCPNLRQAINYIIAHILSIRSQWCHGHINHYTNTFVTKRPFKMSSTKLRRFSSRPSVTSIVLLMFLINFYYWSIPMVHLSAWPQTYYSVVVNTRLMSHENIHELTEPFGDPRTALNPAHRTYVMD